MKNILTVYLKVIFLIMFMTNFKQKGISVTSSEVFKRHLHPIFVETGSYLGDGINNALYAGFEEVYSIELAPHLYQYCSENFKNNPHVHLYLGDSAVMLKDILENIDEPVTFWLDGHYSWGNTAMGNTNTPLLAELEQISKHPIKTHTILIDDVRQFGLFEFDFIDMEQITAKLKEINPKYTIYFEDGYIANDVLVAEIR